MARSPLEVAVQYELSALDEARFGVRTVRATDVGLADVAALDEYVRTQQAELLIVRVPATDLSAMQALERSGAFLADALVYYERFLNVPVSKQEETVIVRTIRPGEEEAVGDMAAATFKGYFGHYHADPKLDKAACDEVYRSWARRSCAHEGADHVVVATEADGTIVGFAALRVNTSEEIECTLLGVAPTRQGRGIGASVMRGAIEWSREQGAARIIISTQLTNVSVQKVWTRLGFQLYRSYYTLHRWRGDSQ